MINKINISESDRRTILSMHRLLLEQETKKLYGYVLRDGDKIPVSNIKVDLYRDATTETDPFGTLEIIDTTRTDDNGLYTFDGLDSYNNLVVRSNQNDFFKQQEVDVDPNTKKSDNELSLNITVYYKPDKKPEIEKKDVESSIPCSNYTSDKNTFYGKSNSDKFDGNAKDDVYDNIVINAKVDAFNQYFKTLEYGTVDYNATLETVKSETGVLFKIVCSERVLNKENTSIKYVTVKINKSDFDSLIKKPLEVKQESKVNYVKIDFRELIQKSMDESKPAFILFSKQGETLSDDLINRFNTNQETIDTLNTNYISVNYLNDETDEGGYISAAEYLDIDKIPSIVIIQGTKTPQPIDGSYRVIKKITDLGSYFNNFKDYLTMVNDLLK
jgi:hypothetical protein